MRKIFTLTLALLSGLWTLDSGLHAQNVSTNPEKRNILIEDFTGIKCGNCPDAHEIIDHLRLAQPELIHSVAIHEGMYAQPSAVDQPDFRTSEGLEIHDYFGITGYPTGTVNRASFKDYGGVTPSRSYWTRCAKQLAEQTADVNIWANATYDKDSRKVAVDVELCYVNEIDERGSALCVSLLQNNIIGIQAGAEDVSEYNHRHVLRAMLTPAWGDTIMTSTKGLVVKRHYEYTLPEAIRNIPTDPFNTDVLVYVNSTDDAMNREILNSIEVPLQCPEMYRTMSVKLEPYKIQPARNYGFNFIECYVTNEGNETITSIDFATKLNAAEEVNTKVNVNIAPRQKAYVRVPVDWSKQLNGNNDYAVRIAKVNGQQRPVVNGKITGEFAGYVYLKSAVKVKIKTDYNADENTFRVLDQDGKVVKQFGPYAEGEQTVYEETFDLEKGQIRCFEVTDAWGDGMLTPRGSIYWYDADGNQIASNNDIRDYGYRIFFRYGDGSGEGGDDEGGDDEGGDDDNPPVGPITPGDFSNSNWGRDGEYGLLAIPAGTNEYGTESVIGADGTTWFFTYHPGSEKEEDIRTTTYSMYLQAIDKMGNKKFDGIGKLISDFPNRSWTEIGQYLCANRDSTVTLVVRDCRNTQPQGQTTYTAYRFRPDGTSVWDPDGVNIDEAQTYEMCCGMSIIELQNGTNVFAWMRSASYSGDAMYIERCHVSKDGVKLNKLDDLRIGSRASDFYAYPMLVAGDDNSYYVAYGRTSSLVIYVQKYDVDGKALWSDTYGQKIYSGGWGSVTALQIRINCKSDGKGGIIVGWNGDTNDPYKAWIAWVKPDGQLGFTNSSGKAPMRLSYEEVQTQRMPSIIPSPDGNGFIAAFCTYNQSYQQYQGLCVQKIDSLGNLVWGDEGIMIVPLGEHSTGYASLQPGPNNTVMVAYQMPENGKTYCFVKNYYTILNAKDGSFVDKEKNIHVMSDKQYYRSDMKTAVNMEDGFWQFHWEQYYKPIYDDDREPDLTDEHETENHHCLAIMTFDGTLVNWLRDWTGIEEVETDTAKANAKANAVYNLAGQKVGKDYKGIVIENGKKILKK